MPPTDAYLEEVSSQLPALQLLINLGWQYLTPDAALALRGGKRKHVILTEVLEPWLAAHNGIDFKGEHYAFSAANIRLAVERLVNEPHQSLLLTNERLYELLTLGTSLTQSIDGDRKSFDLHYIDWQHPERNVYHVTDEFSVEKRGSHTTRRADIVLFVNGIPLVILECKRADQEHHGAKAVALGIEQLGVYQREEEIPHLFTTSQLLLAISPNDALYATTGTKKKFWSLWREEESEPAAGNFEQTVHTLINRPLDRTTADQLYGWREYERRLRAHFDTLGERLPTAQDRLIVALLRPARLLELAYQFVVFDDGVKKIARYQQYFAIRATLARVAQRNAQGTRTGGVIWHTTGSGKSLTMVMLAKALALHPAIPAPRVILVTDRVDLDNQLWNTFHACGKSVVQAQDGNHLLRLVTGKLAPGDARADVITTVINKFEQAAAQHASDASADIFVLVDEGHRSQYGQLNARMQRVFPRACYISYTGTPLTQGEKATAAKFGSFIHKYPMRQAVSDRAVAPLLYEGRVVEQDVDKAQLERWFERTTRHLTVAQRADLKRKLSRSEAVTATEQRIKEIAYNVALHYEQQWRGSGFKAQLATPSKQIALKYLRYLHAYGIDAALVISPPDSREGDEEEDGDSREVQRFWGEMMGRYGSEEAYLREIIAAFGRAEGVEMLVVVDKLLTGFDEPRNTVLYLDKPLKEHTLLQAIARVNRLADGKDFGYIVDYRGVLGELNAALNRYDALAAFDAEDVAEIVHDIEEQIALLPQRHSDLWAIFAPVANRNDREALERFLAPEDRRQRFYTALTAYAQTLRVALSSVRFFTDTPDAQIARYQGDLKFFHALRQAVRLRYAEAIDYREYEAKVRKLMDEHIRATGTTAITGLVNIFDVEKFDAEVARLGEPAAKADTILNRIKRTIAEQMDEDPAFYRKFSELVEETIQAYRQGRLDELETLRLAEAHLEALRRGRDAGAPPQLLRYRDAPAYYGVVRETLAAYGLHDDAIADIAIRQEAVIEQHKVTDWARNHDVQNDIRRGLDDLFYEVEAHTGQLIAAEQLGLLIEQVIEVAKARSEAQV
jgi:type I restriction enzyme R subunit